MMCHRKERSLSSPLSAATRHSLREPGSQVGWQCLDNSLPAAPACKQAFVVCVSRTGLSVQVVKEYVAGRISLRLSKGKVDHVMKTIFAIFKVCCARKGDKAAALHRDIKVVRESHRPH